MAIATRAAKLGVALALLSAWFLSDGAEASCKYCESIGGYESCAPTTCAYARDPAGSVGADASRTGAALALQGSGDLIGIRSKAVNDAMAGRFPEGPGKDLLLLHDSEPRDGDWAQRREQVIEEAFRGLDHAGAGLLAYSASCATSVCEVGVIQSRRGAEQDRTNWQTQFVRLTGEGAWGDGIAETAMVAVSAGAGRVAYFAYIHYDR